MTRRLALLALFAASACAPPRTTTPAAFLDRPPGALVVDVRTAAEYASGHVAGARNVDVNGGQFEAALDSVDRATPVYLYCRTGRRSGAAAEALTRMGFETVVNAGGFDSLAAAGAPTE
ncbi:MAG TPA: rhodanese-like domain-containing protein [Rubricoccaceae bacterium]|jgi:rhodanese-related sulfurtransferase